MNSVRISIAANQEQQDILVSELSDWGAEGFEQFEDRLLAYFPELNFNSYEVNKLLSSYVHETSIVKEQNWNAVWEKNFEPVVVEGFCMVRADFHEQAKDIPFEIIITPKMSFGTGHHATTYMMMEQMKDLNFQNKNVFDFGTGTGILSILAEKMGAEQIIAIDNDKWSIENPNENIQKNNCNRIRLFLSANITGNTFDVLLANINRNIILQFLNDIYRSLNKNGRLLMSGLLTTDEADIMKACKNLGLEFVKRTERNNWISILMKK